MKQPKQLEEQKQTIELSDTKINNLRTVHGYEFDSNTMITIRPLSAPQRVCDRYMGHAVVNTLLPAALSGVLEIYDQKLLEKIAKFLGPKLMVSLPTLNLVIAGGITVAEAVIRKVVDTCARKCSCCEGSCCTKHCSTRKNDLMVSTPLPGIIQFSRTTAVAIVVVGWVLQTTNGLLRDFNPNAPGEYIYGRIMGDALFGFFGQLIIGTAVGKAAESKLGQCIGRGLFAAGSCIVQGVASGWNYLKSCVSSEESQSLLNR